MDICFVFSFAPISFCETAELTDLFHKSPSHCLMSLHVCMQTVLWQTLQQGPRADKRLELADLLHDMP